MFALDDDPSEAGYWAPIVLAEEGLLIFAITCWLWWISIIFARRRFNEGRKPAAFFIASLPIIIVLMGAIILEPIYQLFVSLPKVRRVQLVERLAE
jgi:low temperature requirement protein LtrA